MKTFELAKKDVLQVAESIGITLTNEQVFEVIDEYPAWAENDPTGTWDIIVEDIIYFVINQ